MTRNPTNIEKLVFGADVEIDPVTDRPIERGIGSILPVHAPAVSAPAPVEAPMPEMPHDAQAH